MNFIPYQLYGPFNVFKYLELIITSLSILERFFPSIL